MAGPTKAALLERIAALEKRVRSLGRQLRRKDRTLEVRDDTLAEAVERQAATARILRVISSTPTDLHRVFETIAETATQVCDAFDAVVVLVAGSELVRVAHYGLIAAGPVGGRLAIRGTVAGRVVLYGRAVQVEDLTAADDFPEAQALARGSGYRTTLGVPLLREGVAMGAIIVRRTEVRPFSGVEVELLETFATEAVIAMESARLFSELQARRRELSEALEPQTATAEILRVISRSPTDLQPMLDTIVRNAGRVCDAVDATVVLIDGGELAVAAHHGPIDAGQRGMRIPLSAGTVMGRTVLEGRPVRVEDLASADDFPEGRALARRFGHRSTLAAPLLREGAAVGAILIRRTEVRPFSDKQVELLKPFADLAVIAIENARRTPA